jgi:CopZ-like zinc binding protein
MSSCCSDDNCRVEAESASEICPSCGSKGTSVDPVTLKALLTGDGLRRGVPPAPRFCATADCPVVYFDHAVPIIFREDELTVPVHAKHPDDDRVPVCYCFGYTPPKIRVEGKIASKTITAEVKAGHCACEVKNPKGVCCLGDVARVERLMAAELVGADR